MTASARVDLHQHIWTEPLLAALANRDRLPFVRRAGATTIVHCAGECAYAIDTEIETPSHRAGQVRADGLDLALIALSSPIGIEALPRQEARALIDAHLVYGSDRPVVEPEHTRWDVILQRNGATLANAARPARAESIAA